MREKGQSLFEVVLATAVVTLIITAVVSLAANSLRNATYSRLKTQATRFAQEAVEWLRDERDNDFAAFKTRSTARKWCLASLGWGSVGACSAENKITGTPFRRQLNFDLTTKSGKTVIEATVAVSWEDSQGFHEVKSITYFTDWRER